MLKVSHFLIAQRIDEVAQVWFPDLDARQPNEGAGQLKMDTRTLRGRDQLLDQVVDLSGLINPSSSPAPVNRWLCGSLLTYFIHAYMPYI